MAAPQGPPIGAPEPHCSNFPFLRSRITLMPTEEGKDPAVALWLHRQGPRGRSKTQGCSLVHLVLTLTLIVKRIPSAKQPQMPVVAEAAL